MSSLKYDLGGQQPAIEPGSWVLVTGVTGLIGGHIADKLLQAGYNVKGVSRSASKAQWTADHFNKTYGADRYEVVEIPDMNQPQAYAEAFKGVSGVVHAASDLSLSSDPNKVIPPTISHIRGIMSAAAAQPSIKRFVYTSSSSALTLPKPNEKVKITTSSWNEEAVKIAWNSPPDTKDIGFIIYAASKKLGEEEAWKFVKEHKPSFTFNAILPNANFGRRIHPLQNSSTSKMPLLVYESGRAESFKFFAPQWFVDVEDTALLHVAALIDPSVANERILAFSEPINSSRLLSVYKHLAPGKHFEAPDPDEPQDLMEIPNERGVELLRKFNIAGWTSLEESLKGRLVQDQEQERAKAQAAKA